jgi:membrane protein YqaA with SNARE-associated domain
MEEEKEESKSSFLIKNLAKGLAWFVVIIAAYILVKGELEFYKQEINQLGDNMPLLLSVFTVSEIVFGVLPPEIFMLIWQTKGVLSEYIFNLSILTLISYAAGVLGYFIGKFFSKTELYGRIHQKYLKQYDRQLKRFGGYLVLVGAVTPVPFSATCMMAGSVNLNFKNFLLICISRIIRFAFYGYFVWSSPQWF